MKKILIVFVTFFNVIIFSQTRIVNKNVEFFGGEVWSCKIKINGYGDYNNYLNLSFKHAYLTLKNPASFRVKTERNIDITFYKDTNIIEVDTLIAYKQYNRTQSLVKKHLYLDSGVMIYEPLILDYKKVNLYYKKLTYNFKVVDKMCKVFFYYFGENGYNNEGIITYNENYNITKNYPKENEINNTFKNIIDSYKIKDSLKYIEDFISDSISYRKEFINDSVNYKNNFLIKELEKERKLLAKKMEEERKLLAKKQEEELITLMKKHKKNKIKTISIIGTFYIGVVIFLTSL